MLSHIVQSICHHKVIQDTDRGGGETGVRGNRGKGEEGGRERARAGREGCLK